MTWRVWITRSSKRQKRQRNLEKQKRMSMEVSVLRPLAVAGRSFSIAGKPTLSILRPKNLPLLRLSLPVSLPHFSSSSSTSRLSSPSQSFSFSLPQSSVIFGIRHRVNNSLIFLCVFSFILCTGEQPECVE